MRYAIKHKPTNTFLYEDEGGAFLIPEEEAFITFGRKLDAEEMLDCYDDVIYTENGDFPVNEFEVVEI
jgi:hypothetical protein